MEVGKYTDIVDSLRGYQDDHEWIGTLHLNMRKSTAIWAQWLLKVPKNEFLCEMWCCFDGSDRTLEGNSPLWMKHWCHHHLRIRTMGRRGSCVSSPQGNRKRNSFIWTKETLLVCVCPSRSRARSIIYIFYYYSCGRWVDCQCITDSISSTFCHPEGHGIWPTFASPDAASGTPTFQLSTNNLDLKLAVETFKRRNDLEIDRKEFQLIGDWKTYLILE